MNPQRQWQSIFGIVPPHILEAIVKYEDQDAQQRQSALQTLMIAATIRSARLSHHLTMAPTAVTPAQATTPHKQRAVYTANHTTTLPGTLLRSEGQGPTGDAATDEAYDGLGATFDLYWTVFKRNSIDNAGMNLIGTVHYGQNYDNASSTGRKWSSGTATAPTSIGSRSP